MGAVAALLGRLQGVFGKTFLLAGVLPALILILGLVWQDEGLKGVESLFVNFTATDKRTETEPKKSTAATRPVEMQPASTSQAAGAAVFRVVSLLGVGLFFFAVRHQILTVYQSLAVPQRLRQWLIDREDVRRRRINFRAKQLSLEYTAMCWPKKRKKDKAGFQIPPKSVAGYQRQQETDVWRTSELGWKAACAAAERKGEVVTVRNSEYRLIRDALMAHYSYSSAAKQFHPKLIDHWLQLMTDDSQLGLRRKAVYEICVERAGRFWTQASLLKKNYPSAEYVMPTRLGTRLAALDEYAQARYGTDTTTLWLRLWGLLSKEEKSEVADAQTAVECLLNLATALVALSLYALAKDLWCTWPFFGAGSLKFDWRIAASILLPLLFSWFCYRSAIFATIAFGERVTRYIDLYWLRLLRAMGYKLPPDMKAGTALEILKDLGAFYLAADLGGISERTLEYEGPAKKEERGAAPKAEEPKTPDADEATGAD